MKLLFLYRMTPGPTDQTSSTGIVADAAIFPNGRCVLVWRTDSNGMEIYDSEQAMRTIHERSGRSVFLGE